MTRRLLIVGLGLALVGLTVVAVSSRPSSTRTGYAIAVGNTVGASSLNVELGNVVIYSGLYRVNASLTLRVIRPLHLPAGMRPIAIRIVPIRPNESRDIPHSAGPGYYCVAGSALNGFGPTVPPDGARFSKGDYISVIWYFRVTQEGKFMQRGTVFEYDLKGERFTQSLGTNEWVAEGRKGGRKCNTNLPTEWIT